MRESIQNTELTYRVLRLLRHKKECDIEEMIKECASYSPSRVISEIDRLSRRGDLRLVYKQSGDYAVRLRKTA